MGWDGRGGDERQFHRIVDYMAHSGTRRIKVKARNAEWGGSIILVKLRLRMIF